MKAAFYTLGCKVNQFETQALERELVSHGYELAGPGEAADVCIINTCTVTAESDRKSRQAVRRARKANPDAVVAVCGCFPQVSPGEAEKLGADIVAGTGDRTGFIRMLEEAAHNKETIVSIDDPMRRRVFEKLPAGGLIGRTRAMLKVQDGCVNFCSYCIIPYARGPVRSLSIADAAEEAEKLADNGYKEIVVTGIEISSYGLDFGEKALPELVTAVCRAAPGVRIRLGSLEPGSIDEELVGTLSRFSNVCPHFHLSLQSGCDETLRRMRRKYDTARFLESVGLLREAFPGCALTADLITGFPQETEEEFDKTLEFIRRCKFARMHIFPYSKREGTGAAAMEGQIPQKLKEQRASRAKAEAGRMKTEYLKSCVGTRQQVLFEREKNGASSGHAPNYAEVSVAEEGLRGSARLVEITGLKDGGLSGVLI